MRWVGSALGAILGIVVAIVLYRAFSSPRCSTPPPAAQGPQGVAHTPVVAVPAAADERARDELGARRIPFYRSLRRNFADSVLSFAVTDQQDTLDIVLPADDQAIVADIVRRAIAPSAYDYGFRRVRFFVRSPVGSSKDLRAVAEASRDEGGTWNTFLK